jgi:hypothetical protein
MSALAKRGKDSPPIDIDLIKVSVLVSEKIEKLFEETNPYVSMPAFWGEHDACGGPSPDDPLLIKIDLPFGHDEDHEPFWTVSLVDVVEDFLVDVREDTSYWEGSLRIAEALSALSEKIKAAIAEGEANVARSTFKVVE